MALALANQSGEGSGEEILAPAAAVEQVGEQHLRVDVDDPPQKRVGAEPSDRRDDALGDPAERVRARVQ